MGKNNNVQVVGNKAIIKQEGTQKSCYMKEETTNSKKASKKKEGNIMYS
jgi:hypothetical protein